jgi:dolichyl-phosphate-mannose-protein mannosyltransferase
MKRNRHEVYVYALLAAMGALLFALSCNASDFVIDSYYYELARSLLAGSGYGFNLRPETMVPPGFPALLAVLVLVLGPNYVALMRSITVFTSLGLIASYEVLRSAEGRGVAAASCLLLASSPALFGFSTTMLFSDMPYFCASTLLLWAAPRLDSCEGGAMKRASWWMLCGLLLFASILMRSTGIALIGGILGWLVVSFFREREAVQRRLAMFLPLVVIGIAVQGGWIHWAARNQSSQWPVHGYQENYVAQLKLKNGNDPELGMATWTDILSRPIENMGDMATSMLELSTHKEIASAWYSPGTIIPLALLLIGLASSFYRNGGGILEWYFVGYQSLFLFWPWNFELRFQLPVAPLAFLFMWRGGRVLFELAGKRPRELGASGLVVATLGTLSTIAWGWDTRHPRTSTCLIVWVLAAAVSAGLLVYGRDLSRRGLLLLARTVAVKGRFVSVGQIAGALAVMCLFVSGVVMELKIGIQNLHVVPESDPSIEAAEWIRAHSTPPDVIMARKEAVVYHYSHHQVVWFPASSDPQLLMAGIRRYHVRDIVVTDQDDSNSYWRPSEARCFEALSHADPELFRLVHKGPHEEVFEVVLEKIGAPASPTTGKGTA